MWIVSSRSVSVCATPSFIIENQPSLVLIWEDDWHERQAQILSWCQFSIFNNTIANCFFSLQFPIEVKNCIIKIHRDSFLLNLVESRYHVRSNAPFKKNNPELRSMVPSSRCFTYWTDQYPCESTRTEQPWLTCAAGSWGRVVQIGQISCAQHVPMTRIARSNLSVPNYPREPWKDGGVAMPVRYEKWTMRCTSSCVKWATGLWCADDPNGMDYPWTIHA